MRGQIFDSNLQGKKRDSRDYNSISFLRKPDKIMQEKTKMKKNNKRQKEPFENASLEELEKMKEVKIRIAKGAWDGPFICCRRKTKKAMVKTRLGKGVSIEHEVWKCPKCGEEYVDYEQGKKLDNAIIMSGFLDKKKIEFKRKLNFDGHSFFLRFPSEITKRWHKGMKATIKAVDTKNFFVEIS